MRVEADPRQTWKPIGKTAAGVAFAQSAVRLVICASLQVRSFDVLASATRLEPTVSRRTTTRARPSM